MKTLGKTALTKHAALLRAVVAAALLATTVGLLTSLEPAHAQSGPLCSRFSEGPAGQDGWGPCATAPNIVVTTTDVGSIGGPGDYHLHLRDTSGASAACSSDPKYKGNWVEKMGGCGQFCFDFKLFKSGTPPASVHPSFSVYDAAGNRATFVANVILTSADPWEKNICAPIKLIEPGENLPSGPSGSWQIQPGGNAYSPNWNSIIQNVDRVVLPVDFTADPSEEVGYDNMCMSPAPCPVDPKPPEIKGCLQDSKVAVKCNADGTYTVTLNGTSVSGTVITMTSQTAGVTVTPPQQPWSATTTWTVTGATAGQTVVLTANAAHVGGGKEPDTDQCCSGDITLVMPDCSKPVDVALTKTGGAAVYDEKTGLWTISFKIDVTNAGNPFAPGNSISINDPVPTGLTFVSGAGTNWTCAASAGIIHCGYNFGSGVFNTSAHLSQLVLTFTTKTPGKYENCATVGVASGGFTETTLNNNKGCDTVEVKSNIDVAIAKTSKVVQVDNPSPGVSNFTFTLAVTNVGPAFNGNNALTVTDVVPAGMTFNSASGLPDWSCTPATVAAGGTLTCTYIGTGPAAPGASLGSITINASAKGDGPWENCSLVAIKPATGVDVDLSNNKSCVTVKNDGFTTVNPPPPVVNSCGTNVIFVVDVSGSIAQAGATSNVESALNSAKQAFNNTNASGVQSQGAVITFSDTATLLQPMSAATLTSYSSLTFGGETNWEAAMQLAQSTAAASPTPVIIVFITDGIPNRIVGSPNTVDSVTATNAAIPYVNQIYAAGVPIYGLGIFSDPSGPVHLHALLGGNDHASTFGGLYGDLQGFAKNMCPDLYLSKYINPGSINYQNNPGPHTTTIILMLQNTGGALTGVKVTDALPPGLISATSTDPAFSVSGNVVTWNVGNMAANTTLMLSFTVTIVPPPLSCNWAVIQNFAQVSHVDQTIHSTPNSFPSPGVSGPVKEHDEASASIWLADCPPVQATPYLQVIKSSLESCLPAGQQTPVAGAVPACSFTVQIQAIGNFTGTVVFGDAVFTSPGGAPVASALSSVTLTPPPTPSTQTYCASSFTTTAAQCTQNNVVLNNGHIIKYTFTLAAPPNLAPGNYKNCFMAAQDTLSASQQTVGYYDTYSSVSQWYPWGDCGVFTVPAAGAKIAAPNCNPDTTKREGSNCVCRFPSMMKSSQTACVCQADMKFVAGLGCIPKIQCTPPLILNPAGTECIHPPVCQPPLAPGPIPGQCVCMPPGTVLVDGKCVKQETSCKPPLVPGPVAGQCVCSPPGTVLVDGKCVKQDTSCKPPLVPGPVAGQCVCSPPGTVLVDGKCVKQETSCKPPLVPGLIAGQCVCSPPGTVLIDGKCVKQETSCKPPLVPGPVAGQCVCSPPGTVLVNGKCVKQDTCRPPMVPGPVAGQCVCSPPGTVLVNGKCVKLDTCKPPMVPGPVPGHCVCSPPGTVLVNGKCVMHETCKPPARLNRRGDCECPQNMVAHGNGCVEREHPPSLPGTAPRDPRGGRDDDPRGGAHVGEPPHGGPRGGGLPGGPAPDLPGRR
jgi:uncharacterized repeat protein (TIGR01451 family)